MKLKAMIARDVCRSGRFSLHRQSPPRRLRVRASVLPGRLAYWSSEHPSQRIPRRHASGSAAEEQRLPPHLQAIVDDYDRRQSEAEASQHWLQKKMSDSRYAGFFGLGIAGCVGSFLFLLGDAGSDVHQATGWLLRKFDQETARRVFMWAAAWHLLPTDYDKDDPYVMIEPVENLRFTSPVGLAAGMDLEAKAPNAFFHVGFSFLEVGPVSMETLQLTRDRLAVRDRMSQLINLGRIGVSLLASSGKELAELAEELGPHVDFFILDVGAVPACEQAQEDGLRSLAAQVVEATSRCSASSGGDAPLVFLRVPAEWPKAATSAIARREAVVAAGTSAIAGGAAGLVICAGSSTGEDAVSALVRRIADVYMATNGRAMIIASGGVETGREALDCIEAGATLVEMSWQLLLTEGPGACRRIKGELTQSVMQGNYVRVKEAIGAAHRQQRATVKGGARKQNRWKAKASPSVVAS